jgi:hypothetical protein
MRPLAPALMIAMFFLMFIGEAASQSPDPGKKAATDGLFGWGSTIFELSTGIRTDNLTWNTAGNHNGRPVNVLSELTWYDIRIYQIKLANRTVIRDRIYLRGHLDFGVVNSGGNRDSDYAGNNRTEEFSRSINGVDGNDVWDGSIGIGPRLAFFDAAIQVCPLVGYAIAEQDLNIVDGYQAISELPPRTPPIGPISGLDSRFETRWEGPWVGLDLMLSASYEKGPFTQIGILFTGEYHWVDYDARANWNLREDFQHPVSFEQSASGHGYVAGVKLLLEARRRWGIQFGMQAREMTTEAGRDRMYYDDGSTGTTRLNKARWRSTTFEAGLSYRF